MSPDPSVTYVSSRTKSFRVVSGKTAHPFTHPLRICTTHRNRLDCGHGELAQTGTQCRLTTRRNETRPATRCRHPEYRMDPKLGDGILYRLVHNVHSNEMRGDSMHKNRAKSIQVACR